MTMISIYPRLEMRDGKYIISLYDSITEKSRNFPPYTDSEKATYTFLLLVDSIQKIYNDTITQSYSEGYADAIEDSMEFDSEEWGEDEDFPLEFSL